MTGLYQWRRPIFWSWPKDDRYERRPDGSYRLKAPFLAAKRARQTREGRRRLKAIRRGETLAARVPTSKGALRRQRQWQAKEDAA